MSTIGCDATLIIGLFAASALSGPVPQPGKGLSDDIKPYPGSVVFCTEHIMGAPEGAGKAGAHITWTGYYSADSPATVVRYYTKILGAENHQKEGKEDIWRFPLAAPERVLTVSPRSGAFLPGQCTRPPGSARTIVVSSNMARPD